MGRHTGRRIHEGAADAHAERGSKEGGRGLLPEEDSRRVGGRALDGELEVARRVGGGLGCGGRRGNGEAAGLGDVRDEGVEPLAGEEL